MGSSFVESLFLGEMRLRLPWCVVLAAPGVVGMRVVPLFGVVVVRSAVSDRRRSIIRLGFWRNGVNSEYLVVLLAIRDGVLSRVTSSRIAIWCTTSDDRQWDGVAAMNSSNMSYETDA